MNCNKCNSANSSNSKFCSTCGATLKSGPSQEISSGQRSSKWDKFATRSFVALIITSIMVGLIYTCSIMVVQEVKQEFKEVRETLGSLGWIDPEAAQQERCTERLERLRWEAANLDASEEPNNLYAIYNLGQVQQDHSGCRDYNSARATFEKVVELYEAKQETPEGEFYVYLDALLALMDIPQANAYDKEQELRERCPGHDVPPSYPDGMTDEQRLEVSERQEEIHQCVSTIFEEFAKKDNENRRIYESKIESVLESLYDENSAYLDALHALMDIPQANAYDKEQELRERCPGYDVPPSYPDGMTEEQRLEVSERQEEIHQCVNTILEEFAKKDNENRRIYESKIESVLESLYDENQDFKWKIESVLFSLYL